MKRYLKAVNFELTRRCNMNCEFCARGTAQNKDITTEIIDKAIDELGKFEIYGIMITGGETLLNKQGFLYLIDEIIRRNFKICNFVVFTNGTVQDQDIKAAFVRIGEHCKKCAESNWGKDMMQWKNRHFEQKYNVNEYASLIISTHFHDNQNIINDTIAFYSKGVNQKIFNTVNQTDSAKSKECDNIIILEGNADRNLLSLYEKGYNEFQLYNNKYCLIFKENDSYSVIEKTINICANGNVTAGCSQSYEHADSNYICNILECAGNLYSYIDKYSWDNPLSKKQAALLISYATPLYLYERGIDTFKRDADLYLQLFDKMIKQIQAYAELIKEVHQKYSTLTHTETQELASLLLAREYEQGETRNFILECFYGDSIITDEDIETGIQILVLEHQNRVLERVDKALQNIIFNKLFSKLFWNKK